MQRSQAGSGDGMNERSRLDEPKNSSGADRRSMPDALRDGLRLQFLTGIGVEDRDLSAAAAHEQALVILVERHSDIIVAQLNRP